MAGLPEPGSGPAFARPWSRVPASVGQALRQDVLDTADDLVEAVRAQVPDYARPLKGNFGARIRTGVAVALDQFVTLLGSDTELPDTRIYRELGVVEHREGRTLAALQAAYQVGTRTLWRRLATSPAAANLDPEVIFALAEALFSYIEQLSAASVAGWAHEESMQAGSLQARRNTLVAALIRRPPADPAELEHHATAAGWPLPARLAVLVVPDAVQIAGRLPGAIGADQPPAGVVVLPTPGAGTDALVRKALRGRRAVLGPTVPPAQAHRSAARALAAWPVHASGGLARDGGDLLHVEGHLVELLLATNPELAADLRERVAAPLRALPSGAAARAEETLRAWLDAHGDVATAAAALHVHPQTIRYRLATLREVYGDALDDPAARLEITLGLRAQ